MLRILDKYLQGRSVMIDKPDFQAFEERIEQLATAIIVTLLASSILGFAFFLSELP